MNYSVQASEVLVVEAWVMGGGISAMTWLRTNDGLPVCLAGSRGRCFER